MDFPELKHLQRQPVIHSTAWIAPSAEVMGDVEIGREASVFYQAVLRGDINAIRIGDYSNIQDGVIIHLSSERPTIVGTRVTVGHRALLHACDIGDECLVGMASTVMDGVVVGRRSIIAAGAVVLPGTQIPEGSLVAGCPAKVKRTLTASEREALPAWAEKYRAVSAAHREAQRGN